MPTSPRTMLSRSVHTFLTTWRMTFKRSLSRWRLLSTVVIGVLLAASVLSGAVIYFNALREVALGHALERRSSSELAIVIQTTRGPTTRVEYDTASAVLGRSVDERLGWLVTDRVRMGKSPTMYLEEPGAGPDAQPSQSDARSYFAFLPRLFEQGLVTILPGGSPPAESGALSPDGVTVLEAVVPEEEAALFGVGVGDRMAAGPTWEDSTDRVEVVISGIFRVNDPEDDVWRLQRDVLSASTRTIERTMPFYVSEAAFLETLGGALSNMESTYAWLLRISPQRITAINSKSALDDLRALRVDSVSALPNYHQATALDRTLEEYDRRIFFSRLPMFVVLILVAVVVVYYVAMLASLVVEERRGEMALLRSRGASSIQIIAVFALEGATIAILAAVAAPFLAAVAVSLMGYTPSFSELTDGSRLQVALTPLAFILSALGAVLSFVALMVPAVQVSRVGVTRHRQEAARPTRLPAFQRYYLDVFLLVISILLFRQLTEQGSVVATNTLGESVANEALLALPGLILVASAMVLLRLFPLAMGLVSRVAAAVFPAGLTMGAWQMARNPSHYARLSLLLILAAGLGIFASSFKATLDTNFRERVLYATGSDVRLDEVSPVPGAVSFDAQPQEYKAGQDMTAAFQEVPGVDRVSSVLRTRGVDLRGGSATNFTVLAVDGESFHEVAWFREDFANESLESLLDKLSLVESPQGLPLPVDAERLSLRLRPDRLLPSVSVNVRLRNAQDEHSNVSLGTLSDSEWTVLTVGLTQEELGSFSLRRPLTMVSLYVEEIAVGNSLDSGSLLIDEITVTTGDGAVSAIEDFDDAIDWRVVRNSTAAVPDAVYASNEVLEGESGSLLFSWSRGGFLEPRGIYYGSEPEAVPVLANRSFIQSTDYAVGDELEVAVGEDLFGGHQMRVTLVGVVDYFPTILDHDERLLVADLTAVSRNANLLYRGTGTFPMELWASAAEGAPDREGLVQRLESVPQYRSRFSRDTLEGLNISRVDPLVGAGWSALLLLAFVAVLILSGLGFLVHAYVSFRNREVEFAFARTLGFSVWQQTAQIWLEQVVIVAIGIGLGTWMGGRISAAVMPFLGHDDWGGQVLPPFAIHTDTGALVLTYAAMFVVFAIISLSLLVMIHRISLHRVLRLGER